MDVELKDGELYLVRTDNGWHFTVYIGASNCFESISRREPIIGKSAAFEIIPLDLAIKAPALQAENERQNDFLKKQIEKRKKFTRYLLWMSKFEEPLFLNMFHLARQWQGRCFMLRKALKLSVEWLDEVTNPDNDDVKTEEGVAARLVIETAIEQSGKNFDPRF